MWLEFVCKTKNGSFYSEMKYWFVYLVECSDGSLYTGISTDVDARILKHNSGKGAKYTRNKTPVILKASWPFPNKSEASKKEYQIKKLSRQEKLLLINHRGKLKKNVTTQSPLRFTVDI